MNTKEYTRTQNKPTEETTKRMKTKLQKYISPAGAFFLPHHPQKMVDAAEG